ncbi:uncharacterized protein LOC142563350 [Dermacentor variabilis]|uniref:uncharacterized protein LOC142563350 n=1 Tax=Dermacentor variabilis TaxID=34621 RepID=UPI003F5C650E
MFLLKAYISIAAASLCVIANAEGKLARGGEAANRTGLRIVEVFNTTQKLWLYQQNYSNDVTLREGTTSNKTVKEECIFLKKRNITQDDYYYWRTSIKANKWFRGPRHGRFFEDVQGGLGSMNVSNPSKNDTTPFEVMKLMYAERNCSVFFVTPLEENAQTGCQLYVRNKALWHGPSENCTEYYKKHCNRTIDVYDIGCEYGPMFFWNER